MSSHDTLPAVDVVVATHDRPKMVRDAIEAILAQDYAGAINVIVVFDKSEPDPELVRTDDGRTVEVITNTRSPGLAGARNSGVRHGSAPVVAFCDDDDLWQPSKITKQVDALANAPDAATCVTGITIAYDDVDVDRVPTPETVSRANLIRNRGMEAHPSTVVVRRDAIEGDIGLVDEEIPGSYGEDYDWILRAAGVAPIAVVEEALVRVVWGSSQFSRKWQTIVDAIDYLVDKHPQFAEDPHAVARFTGRRSFALAALGRRREALEGVATTLRANWRERRALAALAVALRLTSAERLMDLAHRRGRGI